MIKVLVVDDNLLELEIVSEALRHHDIECETVSDPRDAVEHATVFQPDLVILDLHMPYLSGFDLCRLLRLEPKTSDIPVIFLTADDSTESKLKGVHLGHVEYLYKPVTPDELIDTIFAQKTAAKLQDIFEPFVRKSKELVRKWQAQSQADQKSGELTLIFGHGNRWISRAIRSVTDSRWSHVGLVEGDSVIEAAGGHGVRRTSIDAFKRRYQDTEVRKLHGDLDKVRPLIGKAFDRSGILGVLFRRPWQDPDKWFCSEIVAHASDVFADDIAHKITPEDLYRVSQAIDD